MIAELVVGFTGDAKEVKNLNLRKERNSNYYEKFKFISLKIETEVN